MKIIESGTKFEPVDERLLEAVKEILGQIDAVYLARAEKLGGPMTAADDRHRRHELARLEREWEAARAPAMRKLADVMKNGRPYLVLRHEH